MLHEIVHSGLALISGLAGVFFAWFSWQYVRSIRTFGCPDSARERKSTFRLAILVAVNWGSTAYDIQCLLDGNTITWPLAVIQVLLFVLVVLLGSLFVAQMRRQAILALVHEGRYEEAVGTG